METVRRLRVRFPNLADPPSDDICYATQNRQVAVKKIARDSDVVLVVGQRELLQLGPAGRGRARARRHAPRTASTTRASSTRPGSQGAGTVGVTSGASVPERLVAGPAGGARRARLRHRRGGRAPRRRTSCSPCRASCAATPPAPATRGRSAAAADRADGRAGARARGTASSRSACSSIGVLDVTQTVAVARDLGRCSTAWSRSRASALLPGRRRARRPAGSSIGVNVLSLVARDRASPCRGCARDRTRVLDPARRRRASARSSTTGLHRGRGGGATRRSAPGSAER